MQGRKLGVQLIKTLEEIARSQGCYKVILDCSKSNIGEIPFLTCFAEADLSILREMWLLPQGVRDGHVLGPAIHRCHTHSSHVKRAAT